MIADKGSSAGLALRGRRAGASDAFEVASDEHLIPLINLVFLLIIFFLLAGTIDRRSGTDVQPPESSSEQLRQGTPKEIIVAADGSINLDGEPMSLAQLATVLSTRDATELTGTTLDVRADAQVSLLELKPVLSLLNRVGYGRVKLITRLP